MRIHFLQHVSFEDAAHLVTWAEKRRFFLTSTRFDRPFSLPAVESFDALIIMGGPMGVHDENRYPWIKDEKRFIASAIDSYKKVIGICLGAQLIADVLGARVYENREREIGWFPVYLPEDRNQISIIRDLPQMFMAFHWHGDTFDLPRNAVRLGWSDACQNQAFVYDQRIVGLQFHLESTQKSIRSLLDHCRDDLHKGRFIQSSEEIGSDTRKWEQSSWKHCEALMDHWAGNREGSHE